MTVPALKLNLAPSPTFWRRHHRALGWACLTAGAIAFAATIAVSSLAYLEAVRAGREIVLSTGEAQDLARRQMAIQERLQSVDVEKELPVWRLAERILNERSFPWSRATAELERSLVQDVRLKSIQRARSASQQAELRIRGEARSRSAEEAFVRELQKNAYFAQVGLEREAERQGGGVEFEYTLLLAPEPPPYAPLPKFGPRRTAQAAPQPAPQPTVAPALPKPAPAAAPVRPAPQGPRNPPAGPERPEGTSGRERS